MNIPFEQWIRYKRKNTFYRHYFQFIVGTDISNIHIFGTEYLIHIVRIFCKSILLLMTSGSSDKLKYV